MRPWQPLSRSSSSSLMLPRRSRSMLRKVDGRRLNREGKCCPRVEIALPSFCSGKKSLLLAIRGRLDERGIDAGDGDLGGGVVAPFRSAMVGYGSGSQAQRDDGVLKSSRQDLMGQLTKLGSSSPLSVVLILLGSAEARESCAEIETMDRVRYSATAVCFSTKHMVGSGVAAWCRTRRRLAEKRVSKTGDLQLKNRKAQFWVAIASSGETPLTVVGFDLSQMFHDGNVSLGILWIIHSLLCVYVVLCVRCLTSSLHLKLSF